MTFLPVVSSEVFQEYAIQNMEDILSGKRGYIDDLKNIYANQPQLSKLFESYVHALMDAYEVEKLSDAGSLANNIYILSICCMVGIYKTLDMQAEQNALGDKTYPSLN